MKVFVVSHTVEGTGGFDWWHEEHRAHAERAYEAEVHEVWGDEPVNVRLLEMDVPDGLSNQEITDLLDEDIDELELFHPALKQSITREDEGFATHRPEEIPS